MAKNTFERLIPRCGTVKKAANILRTSHLRFSLTPGEKQAEIICIQ